MPATVENLAMDVGYINEPESTELIVEHAGAPPTDLFANEYGFDNLSVSGGAISGFKLEAIGEEPAGFELDNLAYTIPAPPPPPPPAPVAPQKTCPAYLVYDSRGSGEDKGLSKPGSDFVTGLLQRLRSLKNAGTVALKANPYPAVGVFSLTHPGSDVNGLGAFLHAGQIGNYWKSVKRGEEELEAFLIKQAASPCAAANGSPTTSAFGTRSVHTPAGL